MKQLKLWYVVAMMALFGVAFSACHDDDGDFNPDTPEYNDSEAEPLANNTVVPNNTIILGSLSEQYATAMNLRFTNPVADAEFAQVAIVDCGQLAQYSAELLEVYTKGGLIIVCQPVEDQLNQWLKEVNLPKEVTLNSEKKILYAFTNKKSYLMDEPWEETNVNENLNYFIDWVNRTLSLSASSSNMTVDGESKVQDLINCQQFHHEVKYSLRIVEAHEKLAARDSITGVGRVVIAYKVYPIYTFNNEDGENDEYYLVEATTSVISDKMTVLEPTECMETKYWYKTWHKWVTSHGWWWFRSYCRICGFYLTNLWTDAELVNYDGKNESPIDGLRFPARYTPIPETTQNKTSYTSTTNWALSSALGFGGGYSEKQGGASEGSITFSGSLSYTYSSTRDISDINIANTSSESKASYQYVVRNLPSYQASVNISEPPLISVATGIFDNQWIWRVPNVPVRSTKVFYLKTTIDVTYGSCHFWSTGLDFSSNNARRPSPIDQGPSVVYMAITPPNRIPTGVLILEHADDANSTVTDIKFIPNNGTTPAYQSGDNQYKPGDKVSSILPTGKYTVEFTKGTSDDSTKTYVSKNPVQIEIAKSTHIYTDFNMREK